ncbi:MAG: mismatch-specific DNA-glycosylase [Pseudomonadota bacterium]
MTLPDYIDYNLKMLSVGLNPSIPSIEKGYYFANTRNRFWRAFNRSQILMHELVPGPEAHITLLNEFGIGFTDVVKYPSSMANQLRAKDYKRDAPILREKIELYRPHILWFHGKIAINNFMKYAYGINDDWKWGINKVSDTNSKVFVSPNPSSANAAYSLEMLIASYNELALSNS